MKQKIGIAFLLIAIAATSYYLVTNDAAPSPSTAPTELNEQSQDGTITTTDQPNNTFDTKKYSLDDVKSIWTVANKQRPLNPKTYAPTDLVAVGGGQQLRSEAAQALAKLIAGGKTQGLSISPLSGYRSYNTQVSVYNNEVASNGQAVADSQSARPGHSEHQTGLAIDVGGGGCGIEDCFGNTAEGKWVAANAHTYGFIIRYSSGKQAITGYRAEPWHIRYVGAELATEMQKQGVQTLEEFFNLPAAPSY